MLQALLLTCMSIPKHSRERGCLLQKEKHCGGSPHQKGVLAGGVGFITIVEVLSKLLVVLLISILLVVVVALNQLLCDRTKNRDCCINDHSSTLS
jgi:hypothetical protein